MTANVSRTAPRFALADATTWADPWPMYRTLRDDDPVHRVIPAGKPDHDFYVLSRHADIFAAARDHQTFSSAQGLTVNYGELELIGLQDNPPMVMQDPPGHTAFRQLVSRGFTPRQVEAVEPKIGEVVAANTSAAGIGGALGTLGDALGEMMGYFTALVERRRTQPEDDTISHLVAAGMGADGDMTGLLSILAFTFTMVTGGNDTSTGMLGGATQLLHQRPDQRRLLVDDPDLIPDAVDEFLRLTSPVQGLCRTVTRDVIVGDTTIPEGRRVMLLYGSGNRDERQFGDNAGELDVRRRPRNILTFSHGAHHCLGAAAARMQSRVALSELLSRCPEFEVDEDAIVWAGGSYVRRPLSVPITVT